MLSRLQRINFLCGLSGTLHRNSLATRYKTEIIVSAAEHCATITNLRITTAYLSARSIDLLVTTVTSSLASRAPSTRL